MNDADVTDLCTARAYPDAPFGGRPVLGCLDADGHGQWHYDPLDDITWRHGRHQDSPPPGGANREENSMSFSFAAVGTKEEVTAQLGRAVIGTGDDRFNEFGVELRDLLVKHFEAETAAAYSGGEYRYVVKANGHGGGNSPLSVQLTIDAQWVPVPPAEEPQIISGDGGH